MNKKISAGVCISLIAIACAVTFVITWTVSLNMYNDIIPGKVQRDEMSAKLQEIDSFIRNNLLYEIKDENVSLGVYSGYISGVGDKNAFYMTAEEYTKRTNEQLGKITTSGIRAEEESSGYIEVVEVYPSSSAEKMGIQKHDLIVSIDGVDVLSVDATSALKLLEGEENTRLNLTIRREGEDYEHSLVRESIEIVSVEHGVINNAGFIRITDFNALTAEQFDNALNEFVEQIENNGGNNSRPENEIHALLLDLRGNASDFYEPVQQMVDRFVSEGAVASAEHKGNVRRELVVTGEDNSTLSELPMIILIDEGTSGASELMAAILKSHTSAQLVGETSAGSAYLRQTHALKDLSAICITTAKISLTSGLNYADTGLMPDYKVELLGETSYNLNSLYYEDATQLPDPQLRKAFELMDTTVSSKAR